MAKVVKLAQPGFDARTAGDENLIYNSNWPLLKIYRQGQFSQASDNSPVIATHDLGYIPMYWFFSNLSIGAWNLSPSAAEDRAEFFGQTTVSPIIYNNRLIYPASHVSLLDGVKSLYYYIFALDLTKPFTAPVIRVGGLGGGDSTQVFKLIKDGKDITSHNLEDFVVHSRARSPLVHSVNPGKATENLGGGVWGFTVNHGLGYSPIFFAYILNNDGSYSMLGTGTGGSTSLLADEQKVQFKSSVQGDGISIVILKDPFNIDYSVSVTI